MKTIITIINSKPIVLIILKHSTFIKHNLIHLKNDVEYIDNNNNNDGKGEYNDDNDGDVDDNHSDNDDSNTNK